MSGVRVAGAADAGALAAMLHAFNTEFGTSTPGPDVLAERLRGLLARDDVAALLTGDPPAGLAVLTFRPSLWEAGPVALLEELYVRPELRGGGLGTALLHRAFDLARERGSESFEIHVDEGDTDARRFYERHGVSTTGPDQDEPALYYFRTL